MGWVHHMMAALAEATGNLAGVLAAGGVFQA